MKLRKGSSQEKPQVSEAEVEVRGGEVDVLQVSREEMAAQQVSRKLQPGLLYPYKHSKGDDR